MKINWKKGLFSCKYELFNENIKLGELNGELLNQTTIGTFNNQNIGFKPNGFFSYETEITDLNLNKKMGVINFNKWWNKGEVTINDKKNEWKFDHFMCRSWSIWDRNKLVVKYKSSSLNGDIEATTNNELLLLSGLYIAHRYVMLVIYLFILLTIITSI